MNFEKLKETKKQNLIADIKELLKEADDFKFYELEEKINNITLKHFNRAKSMFCFFVYCYARELYLNQNTTTRSEEIQQRKILRYAEQDLDKQIHKYELTQLERLETRKLPF